MKYFCFRFDVDTPKCIKSGVPNLISLSKKLDVPFTFFINMGRGTSRWSFIKKKISFNGNSTPHRNLKLSNFKNIGTSIIHLDPGIDTGDIAMQGLLKVNSDDTLLSIKKKNVELSLQLIIQTIEMAKTGNLPKTRQSKLIDSFYKTPRFIDFFQWSTSSGKNIERFS